MNLFWWLPDLVRDNDVTGQYRSIPALSQQARLILFKHYNQTAPTAPLFQIYKCCLWLMTHRVLELMEQSKRGSLFQSFNPILTRVGEQPELHRLYLKTHNVLGIPHRIFQPISWMARRLGHEFRQSVAETLK